MSLYAIGQRVWIKSHEALGVISEANYETVQGKRKAVYLVSVGETEFDWLTRSDDLRAADWCCEGCDRWLPGQPFRSEAIVVFGEVDDTFNYCFLCVNMLEASKEKREMAAADGYGWQT